MKKKHLLYTTTAEEAAEEVKLVGGQVTQYLTPSLLVANFDEHFDETGLTLSSTQLPAACDQTESLFVQAWHQWQAKEAGAARTPRWGAGLSWDAPGFMPPEPYTPPSAADGFGDKLHSSGTPTSLEMTGNIKVGVVIVSGPDSLAFSINEQVKVVANVMEGADFLAAYQPAAKVTFSYELYFPILTIPAPTGPCIKGDDRCEAAWRDPALMQLGYPIGMAGCAKMAEDLQAEKNMNWAYIAFFIKYPSYHYGYASGARLCLDYDNSYWGPDNLDRTFAHESCHLFGARDEYARVCDCVSVVGIDNVVNGNCENCAVAPERCLMNHNDFILCTYTQGQLGWWPRKGISVFHQGAEGADYQLWSATSNNKGWWTDQHAQGVTMLYSPSAITFNKQIYVFYQGNKGATSQLWHSIYTGSSWVASKQIPQSRLNYSPSSVVFSSRIYIFHQGCEDTNSVGQLWYTASKDGTDWDVEQRVPNTSLHGSPSTVVFNNQLYVFYQGAGGARGELWYSVLSNSTWGSSKQVPPSRLRDHPSAVVFNNKLYVFHQGSSSTNASNQLWYTVSSDGVNWSTEVQVPGAWLNNSPSAIVSENQLYIFYKGSGGADNLLWYSSFDNSAWSVSKQVPATTINSSPAAVLIDF